MAISMIEFQGQIPRQQDFQTMKQNEDMKPALDYNNIQTQVERNAQSASNEVVKRNDVQWNKDEEKGNGNASYHGDGGKNRKKKAEDKVVKKDNTSFDIRI